MHSLSARLLILTLFFVMVAEILIFAPSVARYRETWLMEKLGSAHLAILTLDAAPDPMVSEELKTQLLSFVGARSIALRRDGAKIVLLDDMPPSVDAGFDLGREDWPEMIVNALALLVSDGERLFRVTGPSPKDPSVTVEVVFEEKPLCDALLAFSGRILLLSLVISFFTAFLVYLALRWQFVRPMRRLTRFMTRFRENPEDASRIIRPAARRDEVGTAERELAVMQTTLHDTLTQRRHLAALGTAVAKMHHDLRGILSSALVVSDRLESSADPEVQRVTPTLIQSIERAVKMCSQTLDYVGRGEGAHVPEPVALAALAREAGEGLPESCALSCEVPETLTVEADRDQLFRLTGNLLRNAAESGATTLILRGREGPGADGEPAALVDLVDDGPGLPPRAQENLFKPFEGSARAGGTGLGLAIARELARTNGGDLTLVETGARGTRFRLVLPLADGKAAKKARAARAGKAGRRGGS